MCVHACNSQVSGSLQFLSGKEAAKPRAIHLASSCYTFLDMYSLAMLRYLFDRAKPVTSQGALQNLSWRRL